MAHGHSQWTVDTLKELMDERDKRYSERHEAQKTAIGVAQENAEKWRCVEVGTPVLCADLIWRPAGELRLGDGLIGFDESPMPPLKRWGRRFRKSMVLSNSIRVEPLLLVTTPLGSVRCSYNHPWLARRVRRGTWAWIEAKDLKKGDEVQHVVSPWEVDDSWQSGWLAGMWDGEGCLHVNRDGSAQLSMTQRTSETADRIFHTIGGYVGGAVCLHQKKEGKVKARVPILTFTVAKRANVMMLLGRIRPPRLLSKSEGVWMDRPLGGPDRHTFISSIENIGDGKIAVLGTSSGTYIAGGFAMHNSNANEWRAAMSDKDRNFVTKSTMWGYFIGAVGLSVLLISLFLKTFAG